MCQEKNSYCSGKVIPSGLLMSNSKDRCEEANRPALPIHIKNFSSFSFAFFLLMLRDLRTRQVVARKIKITNIFFQPIPPFTINFTPAIEP